MDEQRSYGIENFPAASLLIKPISLNTFQYEWQGSPSLKNYNNLDTIIFIK
jgi:hypothetical protein